MDEEVYTAWLTFADGSGSMSKSGPSMFSVVREVHAIVQDMAERNVTFSEISIKPGGPFSEGEVNAEVG